VAPFSYQFGCLTGSSPYRDKVVGVFVHKLRRFCQKFREIFPEEFVTDFINEHKTFF
jgi:hypothetical protein